MYNIFIITNYDSACVTKQVERSHHLSWVRCTVQASGGISRLVPCLDIGYVYVYTDTAQTFNEPFDTKFGLLLGPSEIDRRWIWIP